MEHDDITIVACNDPFIEPHYAVSHRELFGNIERSFTGCRKCVCELR